MISHPLSNSDRQEVEKLIENEPDNIPGDKFLFKIWQMEYIEKGLREF